MATATLESPASERRRAPRRQPAMGTVLRIEPSAGEDAQVGLVWNISASGVSMLFPKPLSPGTPLKGELRAMGDAKTHPIAMRVAHMSKLMTGDFVLGCQFDRALTAEEMAPFVG